MTRGQTRAAGFSTGRGDSAPPDGAILEQFVSRALALTDDQRTAVAERRRAIDEAAHESALRSGAEALVGRADVYTVARRTLARAHLPQALDRDDLSEDERRSWNDVSRLVQLAIDEMLVALAGNEVLHPNHLRELSAAWGHGSADYSEPTTASTSSP